MVELVRRGLSMRTVAQQLRVSPETVRLWVRRSADLPLAQVEWLDRPRIPHHVHNRTPLETERRIIACRHALASPEHPLGFIGAQAIAETLQAQGVGVPSLRTITRILKRHGVLDRQVRRRFPAPPTGWYLPEVVQRKAELDAFDIVEGLILEGQGEIEVFTGVALWGPHVQAWPANSITAAHIVEWLVEHWRRIGVPRYAQFDNDTRFQGGHGHPESLGRVVRLCLSLGVTPVFTPPRETGFQATLEHFNGLWQTKVWHRVHHESVEALQARSRRFTEAYTRHRAARLDGAPSRHPLPPRWEPDWQRPLSGQLIYLRRTDEQGGVSLLGRRFCVGPLWPHRLVRCAVDLDHHAIHVFRLRRREPDQQPLLTTIEYRYPSRRFRA